MKVNFSTDQRPQGLSFRTIMKKLKPAATPADDSALAERQGPGF